MWQNTTQCKMFELNKLLFFLFRSFRLFFYMQRKENEYDKEYEPAFRKSVKRG
jgi:hypothetical protein